MNGGRVVDADGHVLEPADTWVKYLEPSFRDRAIRIAHDADGYEVLVSGEDAMTEFTVAVRSSVKVR